MYERMLEQVALPLMILNDEGRIIFANKGLEGFTGYSAGELCQLPFLSLCAPYEQHRFIFAHLHLINEPVELDIDLRGKSGRMFLSNITFSPFQQDHSLHLLLVLRDVTTRRIQEGQLRESEERYRKLLDERNQLEAQLNRSIKLACLGELSAGIAHEINNPLGIILGFAQDILDEIAEDHPLFESVRIIEQETRRCVEVVKNLLDLARLKPPQISDVDLVHLVRDSVSLLMPKIKQNKIEVDWSGNEDLPSVRVDPQQLQQALINVMLNSIQAMPSGGRLVISVQRTKPARHQQPRRLLITIADTGQGIAPEQMARIFDPFFSTKGSKGTGLGLAVCQRIIEDHCGKIQMISRQGVGTTCTIALPLRYQDPSEARS